MTKVQNLASLITSKYGTIKRARGPYLYTARRVRLTDLFQEGGRAILGWGSEGTSAFTVLKNVISRGVSGSFDTDFSLNAFGGKSQLSRSVSELFAGDRTACIFADKKSALSAGLDISKDSVNVYKPWNNSEIDWRSVDCILFQPVLPWAQSSWILAVKDELVSGQDLSEITVKLPSPVEAAITRSVYDLIKALQTREEKNWFIWDKVLTKYFIRKGPYLTPKMPEEKYQAFVEHCLEQGVVISPDYNQPSIVPFGADKGAFAKLEKNEFKW